MSNDLSPAQMKAMAQSLSDMGRRGDTQLVHVTPQEVELLKKIGSGTRNPNTGLLEFYQDNNPHGGSSWVDQWNKSVDDNHKINTSNSNPNISGVNTDGTTYNTDTNKGDDDFTNNYSSINMAGGSEAAIGGEAGVSGRGPLTEEERAANRASNPFDLDGDGSMWTRTDEFGATTNWLGQQMNITNENNSGYVWNSMDVDGDGSMFTANNNSYGTNSLVQGKSTFSTVANIAALVANPVAYLGAKAINNYFDKDGDGSMFTSGGVFNNPFSGGTSGTKSIAELKQDELRRTRGGSSNTTSNTSSSSTNSSETTTSETEATDEAATYSDVVGTFNFNNNKFSTRADGRTFLEYNYTGGVADVTGSYTDTIKPFQIVHSMEDARSFAFSEQAANAIDIMVSQLPTEINEKIEGGIHTYMTKDGNIAVIVGTPDGGYVEATYAGSEDGAKDAMNDVANMLAYMEASGDTKVDGGFMGRVASAERFMGYSMDDLNSALSAILSEIKNYDADSASYLMAMERKEEIEREIARRTGSVTATSVDYSTAGVATVISDTAKANLTGTTNT